LAATQTWSAEEEERLKNPIRRHYNTQGSAYYSFARLCDDGIIEPPNNRVELGLFLGAAMRAPIPRSHAFGVFRM
jgi:3-methylcrotonyl-CoA carboxylase beta subunit